MKTPFRCLAITGLLLFSGWCHGRIIPVTLWISGGSEGVIMGGREAPGWLGVSRHISQFDPKGMWLDVGGTSDWQELRQVEDLRLPDVVVPSVFQLQHMGIEGLKDSTVPWTLLNVGVLPQFPDEKVPVPSSRSWQQADGIEIKVFGLLPEETPLRVPPKQIRPLLITDPLSAAQKTFMNEPKSKAFQVVVLPEGMNGSEGSRSLPEAGLVVEAPGKMAEVFEINEGQRLRVRPGLYGRTVVRVEIRWDTVAKKFRDPQATVEWVRIPDLENLTLTPGLIKRVRPKADFKELNLVDALRDQGHWMLIPDEESQPSVESYLLDAKRVGLIPEDQVWMRWTLTKDEWLALKELPLSGAEWKKGKEPRNGELCQVLIPSDWAAGLGGEALSLRRFLDGVDREPVVLSKTSREWRVPLEDE